MNKGVMSRKESLDMFENCSIAAFGLPTEILGKSPIRQCWRMLVLTWLSIVSVSILAQNVEKSEPVGKIQTIADADSVLADAAAKRVLVEHRFADDQRACYPKFFTTACLDQIKLDHLQEVARLNAIENDAKLFKRRKRAEEHDQALANERAKGEESK